VQNGMLDLATGTLKPHDPSYLSSIQVPVEWDPEAVCPTYEDWLQGMIPDQAEDLERTAATMLDPSRTPQKAVFLFGPSRSGKSTFLRLMTAMAGQANWSAVTLHQLAEDRFAAANVFGMMLNCAADLSAKHVEDLSIFKMMTGEDAIQANRKFGAQFAFTNRALFAFSANELPTVGESSRAYVERIKPFKFGRSFAGSEDPSIEARMKTELPGILNRWVAAYQRLLSEGPLATDAAVAHEFEVRSDRVRQWVAERMEVTGPGSLEGSPGSYGGPAGSFVPGQEIETAGMTTKRELAAQFNRWADDNHGSKMGERRVIDRLTSLDGVVEVRDKAGRRGLNIVQRREKEWGDDRGVSEAPGSSGSFKPLLPIPSLTKDFAEDHSNGSSDSHSWGKWSETAGTAGSPIDHLAHLAATPAPLECPDCDNVLELVPPALFWYACRHCTPGTFTRA
jgi:putative DNA primase/helicase